MKIDPSKTKGWTLKTDGKNIEIQTEDNDADRQSAQLALDALLEKMNFISQQPIDLEILLITNQQSP